MPDDNSITMDELEALVTVFRRETGYTPQLFLQEWESGSIEDNAKHADEAAGATALVALQQRLAQ